MPTPSPTPKPTPSPTPAPTPIVSSGTDEKSFTVRIITSSGRARAGAGTEYQQLGTVLYGEKYEVLETKAGSGGLVWYRIRVNGQDEWISAGIAALDSAAQAAAASAPDASAGTGAAEKGKMIRITASSGRARSGPGTEYTYLETVHNGERYEVLDVQAAGNGNPWYKIRIGGREVWISAGITAFD